MQFFIGIFLCAFVSVSSDIWLCIVVEKVNPLRSNDHKTTAWLQEQVFERVAEPAAAWLEREKLFRRREKYF